MKAKTVKERIEHFITIHKGFYDYSLLRDPVKWNSRISVICPVHGVFETVVNNHSRGAGCQACAGVKLIHRDQRVTDAKKIHGDKYDYSLWPDKITSNSVVVSICPEHGSWSHTVANHIHRKSGCPSCARNKLRTFAEFVKQSNEKHNGKYRYVFTEDVRNNSQVTIECPAHGLFSQSASNHLAGKGCPACATYGFDPSKPAWFYMLQSIGVFKVGITNNWEQRLKQLKINTPFRFDVISCTRFENGTSAKALETFMMKFHEGAGLSGFDGATEWRKGKPLFKMEKGA